MTTAWKLMTSAAVLLTMAGCSTSKGPEPLPATATTSMQKGDDSVTRSETVTVQAKVVAINQKTRMVTLRGPEGNEVEFRVDDAVKNLPQVHKGDIVTAVYKSALAFKLYKPGKAKPGVETAQGIETAAPGSMPAAAGAQAIEITATVTKVDRAKGEVTLKGPKGKLVTVKAQDPSNLDKVKKGDLIKVTYTEAVAIAVDKN